MNQPPPRRGGVVHDETLTPSGGHGHALYRLATIVLLCFGLLLSQVALALDEDKLLILQLRLDGRTIASELLGYRGEGGVTMLPLGGLVEAFNFPIKLDPAAGRAEGWYIHEGHAFLLDIAGGYVISDGRSLPLPNATVVVQDNEIYVDHTLLAEWFPIDFRPDLSLLQVELRPREELPIQARYKRMSGNTASGVHGRSEAQYPLQPFPYQAASIPTTDIGLGYTISRDKLGGKPDISTRHSIITSGDLAFMSSRLFITGSDSDLLEQARLSLYRDDPDAGLLGPLHATRFVLGDITAVQIPIYQVSAYERGLRLENSNLRSGYGFDTTDISGDLLPEWEVELYRNSILIGYQVVGSNGRYEFLDTPLYYGNNEFELIFYGPNGQVRRMHRSHYIGPGMLQPGSTHYQLSLSQKDRELLEVEGDTVINSGRGSGRLVALLEHGLTQSLSLGTGAHSVEFDSLRHNYLNLGLRATLPGLFASLDAVADTAGGEAYSLLLQLPLENGSSLRARQMLYNDFVSENDYGGSDRLRSTSNLSLATRLGGMPMVFSFDDIRRDQSSDTQLRHTLSARFTDLYLSHDLKLIHRDYGISEEDLVQGSMQLAQHFSPLFLRGRLDYTLHPQLDIDALFISGRIDIDRGLSVNLDFTHNIGDDNFNSFSAGLNWELDSLILTPSLKYSSDGRYTGLVSANLALGAQPESGELYATRERLSNKGSVSARVFEDNNGNGLLDKGERPLAGVLVRAVQGNRSAVTNSAGIALLHDLPVDIKSDMEIDKASFKEPFLSPLLPERSILPRPGATATIDFPMIPTGEIDGTLYELTGNGSRSEVANVTVHLYDQQQRLVASERSAFDGFFLFSDLPLGTYTLTLEPSHAARLVAPQPPVTLASRGEVVNGIELLLHPAPSAAVPELPIQPATPSPVVVPAPSAAATPIEAATPPAPAIPAAVTMPPGEYSVQLGSYPSLAQARESRAQLLQQLSPLFSEGDTRLVEADLGELGTFHRIIGHSGLTRRDAATLCQQVKARGLPCIPIKSPAPQPAKPTAKVGDYSVQLGAYSSPEAAEQAWRAIAGRAAAVVGDYHHTVSSHRSERGTLHRLALTPTLPEGEARALCQQLQQLGESCIAMPTNR